MKKLFIRWLGLTEINYKLDLFNRELDILIKDVLNFRKTIRKMGQKKDDFEKFNKEIKDLSEKFNFNESLYQNLSDRIGTLENFRKKYPRVFQ